MDKETPAALTLIEAAKETGLSEQTLRKYARLGNLRFTRRPNGRYAICRDDLLRFVGWFRGLTEKSNGQ